MKVYVRSAGYHGYSMSNNAVDAYENGEMPLSKWTKKAILAELQELGVSNDIIQAANKLSLADLKDLFLYKASWHHTSKMYNRTNFYAVNPDVTLEDIQNHTPVATTKEEKVANPYALSEVSYGEWEGSRKHPKLVNYDGYAVIVDNWAYVYDNGNIKKKKVNGSHFKVDYTYSRVPDDLVPIYNKIISYLK